MKVFISLVVVLGVTVEFLEYFKEATIVVFRMALKVGGAG